MVPFYGVPAGTATPPFNSIVAKAERTQVTLAAFLVGHGFLAVINVAVVLTLAGQWVLARSPSPIVYNMNPV
jgi:hypothetical protein